MNFIGKILKFFIFFSKNLLEKYNQEDFNLDGSNSESRLIYKSNSFTVIFFINILIEK